MDEETAEEFRRLRAELAAFTTQNASLHASHARVLELMARARAIPPVRLMIRADKALRTDPAAQYKIHMAGMAFWTVATVAVTYVFFAIPWLWAKVSIFWIVLVSHYANWATDFDGMSSSLAALHAREARRKAEDAERAARGNGGEGR